MGNSNIGIRRAAKLYKTFSIKYSDLLGLVKRDCNYYFEHKYLYKACWITFINNRVFYSYCDSHGYWNGGVISSREFYKVYQIVESWLREGND